MKKKIVSLILAMVMIVATLVSCGINSIVSRDLSQFVDGEFDKAAFYQALSKLEIADGDYSADPAIRVIMEKESLYNSIADAFITNADKLKEGTVGDDDILYFCYYTTYTDGDKTYMFDFSQMKLSTVTANDTKAKHVIKLGTVSEDDDNYEFNKALMDALADADVKDYIYNITSTTGTKVEVTNEKPEIKVVVSYNRSYTEKVPVEGATDGSTTDKINNQIVSYEVMTLSKALAATDPLVAKLLDAKTSLAIGKNASISVTTPATDTEEAKTTTETKFDVTVDGVVYTYSEFKVQWVIEDEGDELATFTFKSDRDKIAPDGLHSKDETVDVKDKDLTYHIYPVYYYDVPEINAANYIKYALGSKLAATSSDVFSDESYKKGDDTVKSLVEALIDIYKTDSDSKASFDKNSTDAKIVKLYNVENKIFDKNSTDADIIRLYHFSNLQAITKSEPTAEETASLEAAITWMTQNMADDEGVKDFFDIKKEYDDAKAVVDAAGSSASSAQTLALTTAHTKYKNIATSIYKDELDQVYDDTLEAVIDEKIAAIVGAESATADVKNAGDAIIAEKKEDIKVDLVTKYNEHIVTEIGKAVYKLVLDSVKITSYPEDLVEEYYDHLYEAYEYDFYKSNNSDGKSYYSTYGSLEEFLVSADATNAKEKYNGDYVAAITAEAKEYLDPLLKIYVVAKALESDAKTLVPTYIESDITAGAYDANYKNDDDLSASENDKKKAEAEKKADEAKAEARANATAFVVTDAVFEEYKKSLGSSYSVYEENYGERNLRAALQFNRLFYYLVSTEIKMVERDDSMVSEIVTGEVTVDGKTLIKVSFHNSNLGYVFAEETADDAESSESN